MLILNKNALFTIVALLTVSLLQAQSLRITGKVWNATANSPLPGASIVLIDNDVNGSAGRTGSFRKVGSTDVEGRFFLPVIQGHDYTLTVSCIGFTARTLEHLVVDKESLSVEVVLEGAQKSLEQVVVSTQLRRATVASLYNLQKNSSAISDGISAEIISRSPDKNTGDVLKRVSGASIQDNKFVVIRGMNERYNVALLNNNILPSTEADKKAFAFNILPAAMIENLVIYKAATPDLPGDFSGGAIKVLTKDYPSRPISELSFSIGYNSMTTGKNFYKGQPNGKYDAIGYLDNSRLIPGPYYRQRLGGAFILNDDNYKKEVTKLFPNTFNYQSARQSLPAMSFSYTGGNTHLYDNGNKLGYLFSVGYSNGRALSDRLREEYDIARVFQYGYNTSNYDEKSNLSALLSVAWSYGKSKISWKSVYNNEFVKSLGMRNGYNEVNSPDFFYYKSLNNEVSQSGLLNSAVEGVHALKNQWSINWLGSFGYTYRNQPDQKILSFRSADNKDDDYYLQLAVENSPAIRTAGRVYSFLGEYIYNGNINATKQFDWWGRSQRWQFGASNYYRTRNVEVTALGYASLNASGSTIVLTKSDNFGTIFTPDNIDRYNITVANIPANSTDYNANALLNAGYMLLDNKFSDRLKMIWGLRVEKYRQQLNALNKAKVDHDNTDIMPSLLLTYALNNKTNLRLSGSRSVNRPEFRELASYSVYDYDNYFSVVGNPGLRRAQNTNADLRYEYFPGAGEILSASVFYKYFIDPIEQTNTGNDVLSYSNADHASVYGVEVEVRKRLDFLGSDWLNRLTFYTNAAYIKGGVQFNGVEHNSPMQGQSPYLINAGLTYLSAQEDWAVNVLYNRIGPRLGFRAQNGAALNIFENPRDLLDAQVSKKLLQGKLELKLTISDIFAQAFQWYYKYDPNTSDIAYDPAKDKVIKSFKFGTTTQLSVRLNLGK